MKETRTYYATCNGENIYGRGAALSAQHLKEILDKAEGLCAVTHEVVRVYSYKAPFKDLYRYYVWDAENNEVLVLPASLVGRLTSKRVRAWQLLRQDKAFKGSRE